MEHRELYDYFQKTWELRSRHLVRKDLPIQYLFFLVCCLQPGCCHPVCRAHENGSELNSPPGMRVVSQFHMFLYQFLILTGLGGLQIALIVLVHVLGTTSNRLKPYIVHFLL